MYDFFKFYILRFLVRATKKTVHQVALFLLSELRDDKTHKSC